MTGKTILNFSLAQSRVTPIVSIQVATDIKGLSVLICCHEGILITDLFWFLIQ